VKLNPCGEDGAKFAFDPDLCIKTLSDSFRVLADGRPSPPIYTCPALGDLDSPPLIVYTNGSAEYNGNENAVAGGGI